MFSCKISCSKRAFNLNYRGARLTSALLDSTCFCYHTVPFSTLRCNWLLQQHCRKLRCCSTHEQPLRILSFGMWVKAAWQKKTDANRRVRGTLLLCSDDTTSVLFCVFQIKSLLIHCLGVQQKGRDNTARDICYSSSPFVQSCAYWNEGE